MANESKAKRSPDQLAGDRAQVFAWYLKGWPYRAIHHAFNLEAVKRGYTISLPVIFDDVKLALSEYRLNNSKLVDEQLHAELARIDQLERTYWDAWEKSTASKRKVEIEGGAIVSGAVSGGTLKKRTTEDLFGDSQYLRGVQWCIERRCRLLGLDKPLEITGTLSLYEFMRKLENEPESTQDDGKG